jgi:acyl dehydratase
MNTQNTPERPPVDGWNGRFFEDFQVGDVYRHPFGRTITATDNRWFTHLTLNTNPLHFDQHYAAQTEFGRILVNSCFTLALVTGMSVTDVSQNAFANLGWDEVKLPHPVFEDDTIYAQSEVLELRPSKSRPNVGIVRIRTTGFNQHGDVVIEYKRTIMVYRKGQGPERPHPLAPSPVELARGNSAT